MANAFSQLIASFEREGKFPLEADYIFGTVDDLKIWAADAIRAATLHEGLLKVVLDDGNGKQALYWTVNDGDGNLTFEELVSVSEYGSLAEALKEIAEITQTLFDVQETLKALGEATLSADDSLKNQIRAIVGCDDDETVMDVLESLDHGDLKSINEWINNIDLGGLESDLWKTIEGDPIPSSDFQTLRGIEDFVTKAAADNAYAHQNIIKEIDKIETGVGLNADGSYSADPTTNYLTGATSVMHALRILDSLLYGSDGLNISDAYYNSEDETIVIVIGTKEGEGEERKIVIPVGDLIREWEPENADGSPVVLARTTVVDGKDKLSATLKISDGEDNSLAVTENGELYVDPLPWAEMD